MSPQNLVTETISASVELLNLAPDRVIVWPPAAEEGLPVECKIRGPGPIVQEMRQNPRKFSVAFPIKPPTTYIANLNPSDLKLPSGVELLEIKPAKIEFRIEEVIQKSVRVIVSKVGLPKPGLRVEELEPNFEAVTVIGPKGELANIDAIETEDIDVGQYKESVELDVALRPLGSRIQFERRTIKVSLKISVRETERVFENIKVSITAPDGFAASIIPTKVRATFTGNDTQLALLSADSLDLSVDLSKLAESPKDKLIYLAKVTANKLPEGVRLLNTEPKRIEVTLVQKH